MKDKQSLISLDVENMLRLKAVQLEMGHDGSLIIEGKNEQGKSSVLRSLEMLLSGGKGTPDEPLHGDAEHGHIIATFDDIVVKKVFKKGKRPALTITNADGAKFQAPQTMLDKLLSHVTLDPVKFMGLTDDEKRKVLSDLMGFDSSKFDAEIAALTENRRDANREAKRLRAIADAAPFHKDAPAEEVSVSALMDELKQRQEHNAKLEKLEDASNDAAREEAAAIRAYDEAKAEVKRFKKALEQAEQTAAERKDACGLAGHNAIEARKAAKAVKRQETEDVVQAISEADETNSKVRANIERAKAIQLAKDAEKEAASHDKALAKEKAAKEKARLAARDNLPIPDLDITEDAVLYKGKPLSQAGASAELRVSVSVAMAMNQDKAVKLLLIDDAEKLDNDNVLTVLELAKANGFQVIMARVGDGANAAVVIEDGSIKPVDAE